MRGKHWLVSALWAVLVAVPVVSFAQHGGGHGDLTHDQPAVPDATVDFGVLATAPLGPLPCSQMPPFGGAGDPCAYKNHYLTPEEVTILKEGQVTFQVHGGGHAMAIYEVSKDTTRDDIGLFLCQGFDRTLTPPNHPCLATLPAGVANAAAPRDIADGHGDLVIKVALNVTNVHPDNRVWYEHDRKMAAGGVQFLRTCLKSF